MSRIYGIPILLLVLFLLSLYLVYDYTNLGEGGSNLDRYIYVTIDGVQPLFLLLGLYMFVMIYFFRVPLWEPMYRHRIEGSVFSFLLNKVFLHSLLLGSTYVVLHLITPRLFGLMIEHLSSLISFWLRVVNFCYFSFMLYYVFYGISQKENPSLLYYECMNILTIIAYYAGRFYFGVKSLEHQTLLLLFVFLNISLSPCVYAIYRNKVVL